MRYIKKTVAWLFGAGLTVNAGVFLPQLYEIWTTKKIDGISLITFGIFCLVQAIGTLHGIFQRDRAVAIGMGLSLLTCGTTTLSVAYIRYFV